MWSTMMRVTACERAIGSDSQSDSESVTLAVTQSASKNRSDSLKGTATVKRIAVGYSLQTESMPGYVKRNANPLRKTMQSAFETDSEN